MPAGGENTATINNNSNHGYLSLIIYCMPRLCQTLDIHYTNSFHRKETDLELSCHDLNPHPSDYKDHYLGGAGIRSDQIRSVAQSCPTLCDPMNRSTPGLPVHHQLPEFTQTHVHRVSDTIQPSRPLSSPSSLAPNLSQHQSLFQWVNSSHEVARVLEFQL